MRTWVLKTILLRFFDFFEILSFDGMSNFSTKNPEIDGFHFWWLFHSTKLVTCFSSKCPPFHGSKSSKCPIFRLRESDWQMGHFKVSKRRKVGYFAEKSRDQFENGKRIENECCNTTTCKCRHMTKSSFTCFLRHFVVQPVWTSNATMCTHPDQKTV